MENFFAVAADVPTPQALAKNHQKNNLPMKLKKCLKAYYGTDDKLRVEAFDPEIGYFGMCYAKDFIESVVIKKPSAQEILDGIE